MIRLLRTLSVGALVALVPYAASASTAFLVRDIQTEDTSTYPDGNGGVYGPLLSIGDRALFSGAEGTSNGELWTSDGRTEGTALVSDICPGNCSSSPQFLGRAGRAGIFLASSDDSAYRPTELWRSDGTAEGTFLLLDSDEFEACYVGPGNSATLGGSAYFALSRYQTGCELWKSDGTVAGTGMVKDLSPESGDGNPNSLVVLGGNLYFFAFGPDGPALWRSDGTGAGTVPVRSFSNDESYPSALTAAGSRLFFAAAESGSEKQLWTSDGTPAGTRQVVSLAVSGSLKLLDGLVYFLAADGKGGTDLWRSDGTAAGTRQVTDFAYATPFGGGITIAKAGGRLLLAANGAGTGFRLWVSDGTPATTGLLAGCTNGCPALTDPQLTQQGDRVLFRGYTVERGDEPWSTDGTGAGTKLLRDICRGNCSSAPGTLYPAFGKRLFLAADQGGFGVWITDGTPAGTALLAALGLRPYDYSETFVPVEIGKKILFIGPAGSRRNQLWESDGTPDGTKPVTLIGVSGPGSYPVELTAFGETLMFTACDGRDRAIWRSDGTEETTRSLTVGALPCSSSDPARYLAVSGGLTYFLRGDSGKYRVWRTDGTDAGTFPLPPFGSTSSWIPVPFGDKVVFRAFDESGGTMLWESDGTVGGTRKLLDMPSQARELFVAGPEVYFIANIGPTTGDDQLWRTDGTAAGTRQVTFFDGFYPFGDPPEMTRIGNTIFFIATPGSYSRALMKTDGTWEGTATVRDTEGKEFYGTSNLIEFHGVLYFFASTHEEPYAIALWRTDGTPAGTALLATVGPRYGYDPGRAWLTVVGDQLFFAADDGARGVELWKTDGTAAGTVLVRDIAPGGASSVPSSLVAAGGRLFFTADDGVHGFELWESDGTAAGTHMVQDIAPGGLSGRPEELTVAGDRLYFRADDSLHGPEIWAYPLSGPPACGPSERALCLGGRFQVEATWRDFQGNEGQGNAVSLTGDTGYFWFFDAANVEVVLKVLDGRGVNGHYWAFYGALSNVEYTLTITDIQTGAVRRYVNPPGRLGSVGDTNAFGPKGATGASGSAAPSLGPAAATYDPVIPVVRRTAAAAPCAPSSGRLCLNGGRFAVEARWRDFQGNTGTGRAVPLSGGDTGYFWFFDAANVEVVLKVLDGRGLNGKYWVFYGALSSVEYELTVTDTETGVVKTYTNPSGRLASVADTGAF
jgi:ELWxxDGT repeat protein